jgi:ABC-type molybdate transport system substrate-binding protein
MKPPITLATALVLLMSSPAMAAQTVPLYAAGSLRGALSEIAAKFEAVSGDKVIARYGASGLLKDEIAQGAKAGVFASANMEYPRALTQSGKSGPVVLFARNRLCALVRPGLAVTSQNLLEYMLEPSIKVGTSTPKNDPSGDYAFAVFTMAEALRPGARQILEKKALTLTGSPSSAAPPEGKNIYGWHIAQKHADIFLAYCTAVSEAHQQNTLQQIVTLPDNLAVGADYGLTVMRDAPPAALQFSLFILSEEGQSVLATHGFAAPNLPQ